MKLFDMVKNSRCASETEDMLSPSGKGKKWGEDRRRVERAILELVALSQKHRHLRNHEIANAYEHAISILFRHFRGADRNDKHNEG